MNIEEYRAMNSLDKIAITKHARIRLEERGIHMDDIVMAIGNGEIIKEYADDKPLPGCLILGKSVKDKPLHLVISKDEEFIYLITTYFPDSKQWEDDFKTRKGR
ncbi:MAG: DUF4258 domain-containing protein [Bacteroidales bacterium]|nr:DUF4258 domain-containing protein [Lachnoclostridium sp.]MCM1385070.1 DUF4258 domain-containing protein [Lachnoclostridium sp.]MCM1466037.1 DUF4258 domain-containing protein [Bacteroidales bacterium]